MPYLHSGANFTYTRLSGASNEIKVMNYCF